MSGDGNEAKPAGTALGSGFVGANVFKRTIRLRSGGLSRHRGRCDHGGPGRPHGFEGGAPASATASRTTPRIRFLIGTPESGRRAGASARRPRRGALSGGPPKGPVRPLPYPCLAGPYTVPPWRRRASAGGLPRRTCPAECAAVRGCSRSRVVRRSTPDKIWTGRRETEPCAFRPTSISHPAYR